MWGCWLPSNPWEIKMIRSPTSFGMTFMTLLTIAMAAEWSNCELSLWSSPIGVPNYQLPDRKMVSEVQITFIWKPISTQTRWITFRGQYKKKKSQCFTIVYSLHHSCIETLGQHRFGWQHSHTFGLLWKSHPSNSDFHCCGQSSKRKVSHLLWNRSQVIYVFCPYTSSLSQNKYWFLSLGVFRRRDL